MPLELKYILLYILFVIGVALIVSGVVGLIRRPKPEPEPWDGEHKLVWCRRIVDIGTGNGDFHAGWAWKCSCGTSNSATYWRFVASEERALKEFAAHRRAYIEVLDGL